MNPIKILIVEDELLVATQLKNGLTKMAYEVAGIADSYEKAVNIILTYSPDFAILDIKLKGSKTGIDVANYLQKNKPIPFIFLTSLDDEATFSKAKDKQPFAYLTKPFNLKDLSRSIELAVNNFYENRLEQTDKHSIAEDVKLKDYFIVCYNNNLKKVMFNTITYSQSEHVYFRLFCTNNESYLIRSTMKQMLADLPSNFLKIHRSIIINTEYVEKLTKSYVIVNGKQLPIVKKHLENLIDLI